MKKYFQFFLFAALTAFPLFSYAQAELLEPIVSFEKAVVLDVRQSNIETSPGIDTPTLSQTLQVQVLSGEKKGEVVTFYNDYTQIKKDAVFFLRTETEPQINRTVYAVGDPYRLPVLAYITFGFLLLTIVVGKWQGVRGIASLIVSLLAIMYVLVPAIAAGYSPIAVCIGTASLIIVLGSYVTHGISRTTTSAVLGMIATVTITALAAWYAIQAAQLSGFTSEENTYLHFATRGHLNMVALLFGGMVVGLLGVLYDMAIGQAIAVEELRRASSTYTRTQVFTRALRMGREHIGALVNTLAIAYVGASLPLLLLIQNSTSSILHVLNSELIATELIRILIGSSGIVLCVPITTALALFIVRVEPGSLPTVHHHHHTH
jgi:uncharacterized membrane protein